LLKKIHFLLLLENKRGREGKLALFPLLIPITALCQEEKENKGNTMGEFSVWN